MCQSNQTQASASLAGAEFTDLERCTSPHSAAAMRPNKRCAFHLNINLCAQHAVIIRLLSSSSSGVAAFRLVPRIPCCPWQAATASCRGTRSLTCGPQPGRATGPLRPGHRALTVTGRAARGPVRALPLARPGRRQFEAAQRARTGILVTVSSTVPVTVPRPGNGCTVESRDWESAIPRQTAGSPILTVSHAARHAAGRSSARPGRLSPVTLGRPG